ncbi:MAG: hypothetical protein AAFV62_01815 [Pseudomonadota bacterium]
MTDRRNRPTGITRRCALTTLGGGLTAGLMGCDTMTAEKPGVVEQIAFSGLALGLRVGSLELDLENAQGGPDQLEYLFPTPLSAWVQRWAYDRLQARGGGSTARLIMDRASLAMASKPGDSVFGLGAEERYTTRLALRLVFFGRDGARAAAADYEAVAEGALQGEVTDADRRAYLSRLSASMMQDIDKNFPALIRRDLPQYVV